MTPPIPVASPPLTSKFGKQMKPPAAGQVNPNQVYLERIINGVAQMGGANMDTAENDKAYKQALIQQLAKKDPSNKKIGVG